MIKKLLSTTFLACLVISGSSLAYAVDSVEGKAWNDKDRFMIRARAIGVVPDEDSTTSIAGTKVEADSAMTPEIDFTYFFTDHIAAELIAATSKHDVKTTGTANLDLGEVWALPPTITAQYHFNPLGSVRPYVGLGVGYLIWYNDGYYGPGVTSVEYDNGMIYALQVGVDVAVDENWVVNADVKKLFHNIDAKVNNAVTADIDLDPWVFGVGVGYRF
jgi:outer membrane protein